MIEIDYSNKDYREKILMERNKLNLGMLKEVKVSSQLENQGQYNYDIKNLFDNDLDTCWGEGQDGYGSGDTIELRFDQGVYLMCVAAINGYVMNEDTYYNNARIKKLKVEFIDDEGGIKSEDIVEFEDIDYNQIDRNYIYKTMQVIGNYGDGRPIQNDNTYIKLTILDVYEGEKYQDTCISEILIYGYFLGEPNYSENVDYIVDIKSDKSNKKKTSLVKVNQIEDEQSIVVEKNEHQKNDEIINQDKTSEEVIPMITQNKESNNNEKLKKILIGGIYLSVIFTAIILTKHKQKIK